MKYKKHRIEYAKTMVKEMKLLQKNLQKIMKEELTIKYQANGTKKIYMPKQKDNEINGQIKIEEVINENNNAVEWFSDVDNTCNMSSSYYNINNNWKN